MYVFISSPNAIKAPKVINKSYNSFCSDDCLKRIVDGKLQCQCGEDNPDYEWSWENVKTPNIKISNDCREVLFHPIYSSGTGAVRGNKCLEQNIHHYWEVKIMSKLYGTDVMIGVGTAKILFSEWKYKFTSLLGNNSESWGYSYQGEIQHNNLKGSYGRQYGLGSIIGVHLDLCNGTLQYFLNREPLGVAFRGLKGKELYPMVSSTAAQSAIKITCCISKKPNLQMMCLNIITKHPGLYKQYRNIPGLTRIYDRNYFWIVPQIEHDEKKRLAELDEDVTLSLFNDRIFNRNKRFKPIRVISMFYDDELEGDGGVSEVFNIETSSDSSNSSEDINPVSGLSSDPDEPSTSQNSTNKSENGSSCKCSEEPAKCTSCILKSHIEDDSSSDSSLTCIL
ncbi:SPRY domain-containing SOCS box protein 3 isoform X1 [Sitophilus oryzae]|uniref:SPRY domain-containing SOCS box protein 3 isoform X1 n=2 Tax=Sitophilus oryzae TaxID=7048 RepID=A0A6J2YY08_SITOR|nr:SPRY domain-containing SOCS box protein 3 isoform X1 [Sitophilus oryzae]